jgi:alpha-amylase/alpha-mannosidase (GH57 family)
LASRAFVRGRGVTVPLDLVLAWHMHQPDYRDHSTGQFRLPWVYLHAIKDYADMAAHLEAHPGVRAVVNLVPVLLDQIEDYADQFATGRIRDPLLALLVRDPAGPLSAAERELAIDRCFRANHEKMVKPFASYALLHELFNGLQSQGDHALAYLSDAYFYDLVTWYHLAWTGETVRRSHAFVPELMSKGGGFSYAERRELFDLLGAVVREVIPRYVRLAASGRVEISSTPHDHPLGPLLVDFAAARESRPESPLPAAPRYPGGMQRLRAHVDAAMNTHARRFGAPPVGVWPAEGALSDPVLRVLGAANVAWTASGEGVLVNSLHRAGMATEHRGAYLYRPYRVDVDGAPVCFFRSDRLSDLIGFEYAKWHATEAVANFMGELEAIAAHAPPDETPLVSVILDGENCWEYYPYNGFYFLETLYARLEAHPSIRTRTFADVLFRPAGDRPPARMGMLPGLVAGSWVYGDLSTWIGAPDKNRAWDLLCAAKESFDRAAAAGRVNDAVRRQLAVCEASDWFWWLGDYNPATAVQSFESLYRENLARLYAMLGLPRPAVLDEPLGQGGGHPETGGAMRRAQ